MIVPVASEYSIGEELVGPLYLDASALAKLFLPEMGSEALNRLLLGRGDVILSDLAVTEVTSALARRIREGALPAKAGGQIHRRILAMASKGAFRRVDLLATTHRDAERLLLAVRIAPLRAADALHLALALGAGAGTVLTFDRTMARAAEESGMLVWPAPEP
jgi:predicted nucleic acid-binding protein